jgi:hypothetical protein
VLGLWPFEVDIIGVISSRKRYQTLPEPAGQATLAGLDLSHYLVQWGETMAEGQSIQEAAIRLGVSEGAIRKRIRRGGLRASKGTDGRWYVLLDSTGKAGEDGVSVSTAQVDTTAADLVAELRRQLGELRADLERERELRAQEGSEYRRLLAGQQALPAHNDKVAWWRFWKQ